MVALVLARPEASAVPGGRQGAFPIKLLEALRAVLRWTWTCPWLEFVVYFSQTPHLLLLPVTSADPDPILFLKRNLLTGIIFVDTNVDGEPVY
jgi:hypothetical protein